MTLTNHPMQNLILEYLYQQKGYNPQFFGTTYIPEGFVAFAKTKGVTLDTSKDEQEFREAFWALEHRNLVVQGNTRQSATLPWVSITKYGIECYENGKILPHDPNGFLKSIYSEVPSLDAITKMYLEEAFSCFSNMNYLSAVVMVGCALERNVINLTEEFHSKLTADQAHFQTDVLDKSKIKTRFDNFLSFLDTKGYKAKLDVPAKEKLESLFPAIVHLIRITRNEAGHPTGRDISRDEAEAQLLLSKEAIKFSSKLVPLLIP